MNRVFVAFLLLLFSVSISSCSSRPVYNAPKLKGAMVVVDALGLKDARPEFYTVSFKDGRVSFFVLRLGDLVKAYLDACMKCYPRKMGYRVNGFYLQCSFCNVSYPIDSLETGVGSCFPVPLKGELRSKEYVIPLKELKDALRYF